MKDLHQLQTAYNRVAYDLTKAILTPVMGALADSLTTSLTRSIREGVQEGINSVVPQFNLWDLISKKVN